MAGNLYQGWLRNIDHLTVNCNANYVNFKKRGGGTKLGKMKSEG